MYDKNGDNMQAICFKNATAAFSSFTAAPETVGFYKEQKLGGKDEKFLAADFCFFFCSSFVRTGEYSRCRKSAVYREKYTFCSLTLHGFCDKINIFVYASMNQLRNDI